MVEARGDQQSVVSGRRGVVSDVREVVASEQCVIEVEVQKQARSQRGDSSSESGSGARGAWRAAFGGVFGCGGDQCVWVPRVSSSFGCNPGSDVFREARGHERRVIAASFWPYLEQGPCHALKKNATDCK